MKHQGYFEKQKFAQRVRYDSRCTHSIFKDLDFKSLFLARINGGQHHAEH